MSAMTSCLMIAGICLAAPEASLADEPIYVIAHQDYPEGNITPAEIADIYLGRTSVLRNGRHVTAYDYHDSQPIKRRFYRYLFANSMPSASTSRARLLFTGRARPIRHIENPGTLLNVLRADTTGIAYTDQPPTDSAFRIIMTLTLPN